MSPSNDTPAKQLAGFIQKFTPEIASLAKAILAKMRTLLTSSKAAFSLSATGVPLMHRMELWVGSAKKYQQFARDYSHAAFLDTTLTLAAGTHKVSAYAAGQDNSLQRKDYTITVK